MVVQRWMIWKREARNRALPGVSHFGVGSFLKLLIICTLVISTSACSKQLPTAQPSLSTPGSGSPTSASNEDGRQASAQPSAVTQNTPTKHLDISSDDGGGIITFATYAFLQDAYIPGLEEFHKQYPLITVQVRELDYSWNPRQIASAADTTLLSYQAPDSGNYFLDLTPLEESDPAFTPDNYWPGILDACQDAEGRIYGLPVFVELTGIYYQEKAFDAAGLPYPKPGWTWEDFQKAVNALARTVPGSCLQPGSTPAVYSPLQPGHKFMKVPSRYLLVPKVWHNEEQATS